MTIIDHPKFIRIYSKIDYQLCRINSNQKLLIFYFANISTHELPNNQNIFKTCFKIPQFSKQTCNNEQYLEVQKKCKNAISKCIN